MTRSIMCTGTLVSVLAASLLFGVATAAEIASESGMHKGGSDNLRHPMGDAQNLLRKKGLEAKMRGDVSGPVAEVAKGQFVELERQGEDSIWTVMGEFGPNDSFVPFLQSGIPGPLHNEIPEPDRSSDNTSIWAPDFTPEYYENMLFSEAPGAVSMRNFYIEQSSNRYAVNGDVADWAEVPYNAAHYGRNYCGGIVCSTTTWWFVRDTLNAWYNGQLAAGKAPAEIDEYLSQFDVWDRYDADGDGDFNEPDGYIDHFQAVHAGSGEETGGGAQGSDALWSHRWYVQLTPVGAGGPTLDDGTVVPFGGVKVGGSKYWIGDYTIEPEDGGVGVFAHEFGHDLGLPDLYDTSGNTGGASNSVAFWSLYSSGSYGSTGVAEEGIGSKPIPMSAYEKIFLGWSNYTVVGYGQQASLKMGPASANTKQVQQLIALLPDKEVVSDLGVEPNSGDFYFYSGSGDNLNNSMSRDFTLPAGAPMLNAKVHFDIELDWDYAYLVVNGVPVATDLSTNTDPNGNNFGNGITGFSGGWIDLTADLSAYAGQTVTVEFAYVTDAAVANPGFFVDDIAVDGSAPDDAETEAGWSYAGFIRTSSTATQSYFNAYFAEFRTYRGYDDGLRTGPYNFIGPNEVEHFPYQDGLLIWYHDTSFSDNNVGDHCLSGRCGGLVLPVDAHPDLLMRPDAGLVWSPSKQSYDSTFGLDRTDEICLLANGLQGCYGNLPANREFNDNMSYWIEPDPTIGHMGWAGVEVPKTGTSIRVKSISAQGNFMQIHINK